jgi:hypothetical protein
MQVRTELHSGVGALTLQVDGAPFYAEIANTAAEREQGLMGRSTLAENQGMLFVFDPPQQASFWMVNTLLPLDVGFFSADGRLREVASLTPLDPTIIRSTRSDIKFALEVNAGWFGRHRLEQL